MTESTKRTFNSGVVPTHALLRPEAKKKPAGLSTTDTQVSSTARRQIESSSPTQPDGPLQKKAKKRHHPRRIPKGVIDKLVEGKNEASSLAQPAGTLPKEVGKKAQLDPTPKEIVEKIGDDQIRPSSLAQPAGPAPAEVEKQQQPVPTSKAGNEPTFFSPDAELGPDMGELWMLSFAAELQQQQGVGLPFGEDFFSLNPGQFSDPAAFDPAQSQFPPPDGEAPFFPNPLLPDPLPFDQKEGGDGSEFNPQEGDGSEFGPL